MPYGVYISVNGFTGFKTTGYTAGDCKQVLRDARNGGHFILLLDLSDLDAVARGRSLVDVLWDKQNLLPGL